MKKITFLFCALVGFFLTTQLNAQTDQGRFTVGSSFANLSFSKGSVSVSLYPSVGYFVVDNLAVGLSLTAAYGSNDFTFNAASTNLKSTILGVGPYVNYYFGEGKLKPVIGASFSYLHQSNDTIDINGNIGKSKENYTNASLGGGIAYFINDNVSVNGIVNYNRDLRADVANPGSVNVNFGFQIFLGE
jgi:outer membrane protein W